MAMLFAIQRTTSCVYFRPGRIYHMHITTSGSKTTN